jgi:DNA-binding PadR family transcriptional regulator
MALVHAILAALSHQPATGYELARHFDAAVGHFWPASHQQIYKDLARLEAQGLVFFEAFPQQGKPDRKVFDLTSQGLEALQAWLKAPGEPAVIRDQLLLKLYAGTQVDRGVLVAELQQHAQKHRSRLRQYQEIEALYFAQPQQLTYAQKLVWLTLQSGLSYERQWLSWCQLALETLSDQPE